MKWYAGTLHGFDYSAGKCGDALKDLLPADIWNGYLETFAACTEEDIWRALFKAGELFTELTKRTRKSTRLYGHGRIRPPRHKLFKIHKRFAEKRQNAGFSY